MKTNYLTYLIRLRNVEFPVAYESICSKFDDEVFEAENVQQSFDAAKDYLTVVRELKNMRVQHPLTETIGELTKERHQTLLSLRGRVTYFLKSPLDNERTAAKTLDTWLYGYRDDLNYPSIKAQSGIVDNMAMNLDENAALHEAVETLGLVQSFNSLKITTADIKFGNNKRLKDRKAKLLKASIIRETAYTKMNTFRKSIEVVLELKTVDIEKYTNYLDDINWAMADFRSSYLSKTTRNANAALKAEEEKDAEDNSESSSPTSSNSATGGALNARTFGRLDLQKDESNSENPTNDEVPDTTTNGSDVLPSSSEKSDDATKADNSALDDSEKEPDK